MTNAAWEWSGESMMWAAVAVFVAALLIDRLRHRGRRPRRCPKCRHDLSHTPGLTCGECGFTAKRERSLRRFFRSRRLTVVALVLFAVGYGVSVTPQTGERGWVAAVPTLGLISALPWSDPPDLLEQECSVVRELEHRVRDGMARPLRAVLIELCIARLGSCTSDSGSTFETCGTILRTICRDEYVSGATWGDAVDDEPPWLLRARRCVCVEVETRRVWPVGVPIYAELNIVGWYERSDYRVQGEPQTPGLHEIAAFRQGFRYLVSMDHAWSDHQCLIGAIQAPAPSIHYRWSIFDRPDSDTRFQLLREMDVEYPIEIRGTIHDVITPVDTAERTDALRSTLQPRLSVGGMSTELHLWSDQTCKGSLLPEPMYDVAWGVRMTVRRDGVDVLRTPYWVRFDRMGESQVPWCHPPTALEELEIDHSDWLNDFDPAELLEGNWTIHIKGDGATALRDFEATKYWAGEITLPLKVIVEDDH